VTAICAIVGLCVESKKIQMRASILVVILLFAVVAMVMLQMPLANG
jgi:hypothetical protein